MSLRLTQAKLRHYAPYHPKIGIVEGFNDYMGGRPRVECRGVFGQAYDRDDEYAMRSRSAGDRKVLLNSRYQVRISLYSLGEGEVGKPISIPCLVSRHRTRSAAGRALAHEI